MLPNIAQKFPRLDIIKPTADIKNKTHPTIFIILFLNNILLFIYQLISNFLFSHIDFRTLNIKGKFFSSPVTGSVAPIHHTPWASAMDDSSKTFLNQSKK